MKLAIDCRLIGSSGIGTFIENIVYHITQNTDNHFLLIGRKEKLAMYENNSRCEIVECNHATFSWKELLLFPVSKVNQCDAFYTPNFNIPLGIKVPIFSMIHDIVFLDIKGLSSGLGRCIRYLYIKRAISISRAIFTVSEFTKQRLKDYFHASKDIYVVHGAVSQGLVQFKEHHPYQTNKERYIVFLGNLKRHKGIELLIKAYKKIKETGTIDYKLYIVGRFNFRVKDQYVIELSTKHDSDIKFINDATNEEVYTLLSSADALISPSYYEGFGLTPLEAMFLGTPAIISDIPAHREIYRDTPAVFFKSGDIDDLINKLSSISHNHRVDITELTAWKYSFKISANKIADTIKKLLR